ncbi:MAG: hypothetical protein JSR27_10840 [Proteobacteria bacterium]|nr:hypothetical protein [Pseudomonadota bacterium]
MRIRPYLAPACACVLLAACGKSADTTAPLAFVPADTPYVYANIEPAPKAVIEQWSRRMHEYLPAALGVYSRALDRIDATAKPDAVHAIAAARALIDTLKTHDTLDKLSELGLKPDMRVAFYGVGLAPVLRMELGDADKFRATIADIERKSGAALPTAKIGDQAYWYVDAGGVVGMLAIEGAQLVATLAPAQASDSLKRTLFGIDRPAKSLADAGDLDALARQYGYTRFGEGFIDIVKIAERLTSPPQGSDREIATAFDLPTGGSDAACKAEYLDIAHKFPRLVMGVGELSPQRVRVGAQLEMQPALATQLAATLGAAPGTGAPGEGIVDVALSVPVLKLKDFLIVQANAVAAKPFTCASLAQLNAGFADLKAKIDITVPPPASDLSGIRFTLDSFALGATPDAKPNVTGKLLMATDNPAVVLAMSQMAMPPLKDLKLAADGKPVALPAGTIPYLEQPAFAAMSAKALAVAVGTGEDAGLGAYLNAPAANEPVFWRMHFSGKFYGMLASAFNRMQAMLPADKQAELAQQAKMMATYENWIRFADIEMVATPTGIALRETVEQNP